MSSLKAGVAVLLFTAGILPAQDGPKTEIARYIDWLSDEDPEIRAMAARKLVELGKEAVPALEKLLEAKNALEIHAILRDIEVPSIASESPWVGPKDLPSEEDLRKGLPEIDRSEADRYVHAKLADAFAQYKKGAYQRAYDMVGAMILLEPGSRYAEELKKLRRACDTMITQTGLVRSKVLCNASFGTVGD